MTSDISYDSRITVLARVTDAFLPGRSLDTAKCAAVSIVPDDRDRLYQVLTESWLKLVDGPFNC